MSPPLDHSAYAASQFFFSLPLGRAITLTSYNYSQANVVIDRRGRARLTEYGLAPINSDPSFAVAATLGSVGTSRWLAPEINTPTRKGGSMPVMESKAADVFAFAMFAVEVFTGKIPFEEHKNEAVVLRISQGNRPEIPGNARDTGLTSEIWNLLESCWQQDPKKRPTMTDVVNRWQKFVGDDDDLTVFLGCVPTTPVSSTSSSDPFSTFRYKFRETEYTADKGEGPSRRREKIVVQPQTGTKTSRSQTMSGAARRRTQLETDRLRPDSGVVEKEIELGANPQHPNSDAVQQTPRHGYPQHRPNVGDFRHEPHAHDPSRALSSRKFAGSKRSSKAPRFKNKCCIIM